VPPPSAASTFVPADLPRRVGFWGAMAVLIGVVIGSGIFRTPPVIAQNLGDPWLILGFWLVCGTIALCGALTFAELAAMTARSGGVYVFLRDGLGACPAFVFGWTYLLITKPAAAGGIAVVFAEHLNTLLGVEWDPRWPTCAALVVLTVINVLGVKGSARVAIALSSVKFAALGAIVVLGIGVAVREALAPGSGAGGGAGGGGDGGAWGRGGFASVPAPKGLLAAVVPVMSAIMWTYDGWSDVGSIAGEVKDPGRRLPRIYVLGTLSVIGLYVLVNAVYLWFIPLPEMARTATVAPRLMERLGIPGGAAAVTVLIIVSTLGSSHASIMTGARVTFAQAQDGLLFRFLGRVSPRRQTPAVSLWTECVLSCVFVVVLRDFQSLADSFVFTMWIFYGLAAASLLVQRRTRPYAERPFRVPGYPVVPAVFVLASAAMTGLSIYEDPGTTGVWLAVLGAGVPAYGVWRWAARGGGIR
jgi:APA family basic amino acid/polyamine antiporter